MSRKKIAFFVGQIFIDFPKDMAKALINESSRFGYQLEIFANFGTYGDNFLFTEGEKRIIDLPSLEDYSGIILAPDTFDIVGMNEPLIAKLKKYAHCPIVSLRYEEKNFYNILVDDQRAMENMVSHLIKVHNLKKICFMTGRMDLADAKRRLQGYLNVMKENGIPVTDHMIFEGDYWKYRGEEAVNWFLSGDSFPEAIVCSNDYMAISVYDSLRKRNIRVPEDIRVTGFDNIEETRYSDPPIASMNVPIDTMAHEAIKVIDQITHGISVPKNTYVPFTGCFHGTCGCINPTNTNSVQILYEQKQYLLHAIMQQTYLSVDLENCNTMEELLLIAYKYSYNFKYDSMYFCLCEHSETENKLEASEQFTDNMVLKAIFSTKNGIVFCNETFERHNILPEKYRQDNGSLLIFTLHYKNHCMGYLVIKNVQLDTLNRLFLSWILFISNFLDKVRMYEEHHYLMEFRKLSITDEMTGLNNRREMEKILRIKRQEANANKKSFYIMNIDMNGLKNINDTFGHLEGDKALCAFADILKSLNGAEIYSARTGGDEFTICVDVEREEVIKRIIDDIQAQITLYNSQNEKPYVMSASIGYAIFEPGAKLADCMQKADDAMYAVKRLNIYSRSYVGNQES